MVLPSQMMVADTVASTKASHEGWCQQVRLQRAWPNPFDPKADVQVRGAAKRLLGMAWSHRGEGHADADIQEQEITAILQDWDKSSATTPDLIPREAFKVNDWWWLKLLYLIQKLVGPGRLAVRPRLWRSRCMVPSYKRGPPSVYESWRLLEVCSQLGLLQEAVLFRRLREQVWGHLEPGQGWWRTHAQPMHQRTAAVLEQVLVSGTDCRSRGIVCEQSRHELHRCTL